MADRPTHHCPSCQQPGIAYELLACRPCWWRLPKPLRNALNNAHRRGGPAHRAALAAAINWYRRNPPPETPP